ncbi:MAG: helix-turn-helix domain-containing protein [Burkholderiales bacterium]|nr:helix-turn-helix domain-containing protein [Burkholderiales bacterium]
MIAPIPPKSPATAGTAIVTPIQVRTYPDGRMDTKNASTYTGLSEKTLAMMRCNGNGPKYVKRGRIFYFTADVDEWMNSQGRLTSTAQAKQRPV